MVSNLRVFIIVKDTKRYPGIAEQFPEYIYVVDTNIDKARKLAERLSNCEAGCDFCFYVEGDETSG